jgi:hypothetical protein
MERELTEFLLISFWEFLILVLMMVLHHQYHLVLVWYLIVYQVLIALQYLLVPKGQENYKE